MTDKHIADIMELFSYCRPMGSPTEQQFVDKFLMPAGFQRDEHQNLVLIIGHQPRILFSSHMDTVHHEEGRQDLLLKDGILTQTSKSSCLGGDDTAGIWLMLEMIKAGIEGVYVIHYGEERGGIGSRAKATHDPAFFAGIDIAIAFDRMGYGDVITHQCSRRTASDAFAKSLAKQLGNSYQPCDAGIYTDTAEYADLVPECTNISVGYSHAHSPGEEQDVVFLLALREALLQVDWKELVVERDPADDDEFFSFRRHEPKRGEFTLGDLCWEYPDIAADMLRASGLTVKDFIAEVEANLGVVLAA
ncbi:hypothetical protein IB276_33110 [Ensifer sp. ENS04]|uniref:hypothetical protein n=1 Tax=Ensifer sp. ENS04 TaxID=2769281 RepID=UPI001781532B|nr:hypothetical protein [Ensifer sp. ENS04]MBD9544287.1 hypothetical protein [Ensifer sp. ENS04]